MQGLFRGSFTATFLFAAVGASPAFGSGDDANQNSQPAQQTSAASPQGGDTAKSITEEKFGEWALQCTTDRLMNPPCQIIYRLGSEDQKQIATVISMAKAADGKVGMQMALPLGFAIQGGVKIEIGRYSATAAVSRCTVQGCLVEGIAPKEMLSAMLKEKAGQIGIHMMQGNAVNLPIKLDGFAQAYQVMDDRK